MRLDIIPTKSTQVDAFLPTHIRETYKTFISFMTTALEADERIGFSQDILQNLSTYRDFDTYKNGVVSENTLKVKIDEDDLELELENGYGFPDENGILMIDEEIILYRKKEGNHFTELLRGASGSTGLQTFQQPGVYEDTVAAKHSAIVTGKP